MDYGQLPSPCYVLDEKALIANLKKLEDVAKSADVEVILALKAFAFYHAFPTIRKYIPGTTASSVNELLLAKEKFGSRIHGYAITYTASDFDLWKTHCQYLTFNSLNQWKTFSDRVTSENKCGLRINPEYSEVEIEVYNPCAPGSRLGIKAKDLGEELPNGISGLHFHTLCESNSISLENTLQVIEEKFDHLLHQAEWVNFGGGHLITQKDYDVDHLVRLLVGFKQKYNVEIILEPGAAFAWRTGVLVATVEDILRDGEISTAVIDASFAAHMPDCLEMPYTPLIEGAKIVESGPRVRIGGSTCMAGDQVGDYQFEKPLQIGDKIAFQDMMHYTMVKSTMFNGVRHPAIAMRKVDGEVSVLKEFGYEDYKSRLG